MSSAALSAQKSNSAAHLRDARLALADALLSPTAKEHAIGLVEAHIVLLGEIDQGLPIRRRDIMTSARHVDDQAGRQGDGERIGVAAFASALEGLIGVALGTLDQPQRPQREGKKDLRGDAGVHGETKGERTIPRRFVYRQGALEALSRLLELAGKAARNAVDFMGDSSLGPSSADPRRRAETPPPSLALA